MGRARILIADSEVVFLRTTATVLEREGYTCFCTSDSVSAIKQLQRERYNLMITAMQLPGNTRLELLQALRDIAPDMPVILVTSHASLDSALRSIQLRVTAYLVKPLDVQQLLHEVRTALARTTIDAAVHRLLNRWEAWGAELKDYVDIIGAASLQRESAVEATLAVSLHNLARCFAELQDLRLLLLLEVAPQQPRGDLPLTTSPSHPLPSRLLQVNHLAEIGEPSAPGATLLEKKPPVGKKANKSSVAVTEQADLTQLSRREREVLQLLLKNKKPRVIARSLFISHHTVRNHLRSIFSKLAIHSQTELVLRFGQYGEHFDLQGAI
jgi:DNA-binding NarL/FixJ family response regulator